MPKEVPQHRQMDTVVVDLKAHIEWKMEQLPELAKNFHLGADAIAGLRQHLQDELDYLSTVPDETTLRDVMGHYFTKGAEFRKMVTGKNDDED